MKPEIKERIEQIKRGQVPEGYKKTKVGIVPSDWEIKFLSELLKFQNGINADKDKYNSGIKMISVMDILSNMPIYYDNIRGQVDIDEKQLNVYGVTYGDVLFQRSSEIFEDAGKSNVYLDKEQIATYSGFVIRGKKIAEYDPIYFNELLKIQSVRKQIIRSSAGAQHINISQSSLSKIMVHIANMNEQQKIADILSTQDKIIELKEKLIDEKQKQKKYLMQMLLTGKKRLKGFDGEWKKVKLGEILIKGSKIPVLDTALYKKITVKLNLKGIEFANINREMADTRPFYIRSKDEIIIGKQNYFNGSVAIVTEQFDGCICSNAIMSFGVKKANLNFIYNYIIQPDFLKKYECLANGTGQKELSEKDFLNFEIQLPRDEEQNAIVNILSTQDKEIELLQQDLEQEKQKKKALMQLLLTGIIRV